MTRQSQLQRASLVRWSDLYAFHAGVFVVLFILASLTNFGVSLLFLAAAFTVARARARSRDSVARLFLNDALLFSIGLLFVVILSPFSGFVAREGTAAILTMVFSAAVLLLTKGMLFVRSLRVMTNRDVIFSSKKKALTLREYLVIGGVSLALLFLVLSPFIVRGGLQTVLSILYQQLIPWRL